MTESEPMVIPASPSEAEEAAWWDSHRDLVEQRFLQAAAAGTLGRGRVAKRAAAAKSSGGVAYSDFARARNGYQPGSRAGRT